MPRWPRDDRGEATRRARPAVGRPAAGDRGGRRRRGTAGPQPDLRLPDRGDALRRRVGVPAAVLPGRPARRLPLRGAGQPATAAAPAVAADVVPADPVLRPGPGLVAESDRAARRRNAVLALLCG